MILNKRKGNLNISGKTFRLGCAVDQFYKSCGRASRLPQKKKIVIEQKHLYN